ncbi:MAG TPA: lytic murein transglycosylase, partial [Gammaproteobacteria bacterium]|nr:lytic murein transglycosylase [Gammaproteobacteria bacterium]
MWGRQYFCLALILALAWGPAAAIAGDPDYALERKKFRQAEQALVQGQRTRFHALLAELKHYPLYPYLRYRELRRYLSRATAQEIAAFLDEYGDTPMAPRLRRAWLQRLAKRKRWREYLIFYTPQSRAALQCNYHRALLETGQTREALEGIEALWLVGKSQHAACDPVFRAWRKAGGLSRKLVWQRIGLAMAKRNRSLARYLSRYLPKQDLRFVRPWIEVDRNPALVTRHPRLREDSPQARDILVHGIRRLMRTSLDRAARAWDTLKVRYAFSTEQRATVEGQLALRYALQGRPQALERLAALDLSRNEDESLREWRIRVALKLKDWEAVLTWVEHLPEAEREEPRWRYWRARALEALGNNEAREEFEALA